LFSKGRFSKFVRYKESGVHLASEAENLNVKLQSDPAQKHFVSGRANYKQRWGIEQPINPINL
jgi:hypothetical protein